MSSKSVAVAESTIEVITEFKPKVPIYKDISQDIKSHCEHRETILKLVEQVNEDMFDIKTKYILLGGHLNDLKPHVGSVWTWKKQRYCKNIYELAEACFGLCKSTVINVLGISKRFGDLMQSLKPEYEKYNYTQLTVMLPLSDDQLKLVNPNMTVAEIKSLSKVSKTDQLIGQKNNSLKNKGNESLLTLKNDNERVKFLSTYKAWGVCAEVPEFNIKFYKCNLNNGDVLVVTEFRQVVSRSCENYDWYKKHSISYTYRIVKKGTSSTHYGFGTYAMSIPEFISYLKSTKAKFIVNVECKDFEEYKQKIKFAEE